MVPGVSQYTPVSEAVGKALAQLRLPEEETVPTRKAFGRTGSRNVESPSDVPPFSTSHMDGFAIRVADSVGASEATPRELNLIGSLPLAKTPSEHLAAGQAVRVSTGSYLPSEADAVVPVEEAAVVGDRLHIVREVARGSFIFGAGEDVPRGKLVVKTGETIRGQEIGMLVALGIRSVKVWRRPRVAVLATGSELTNSMSARSRKTRNSHAPVFLAMAGAAGCEVVDLGIAPDRVGVILDRVSRGLRRVDLILMTGGTSVGKLDLADEVLSRLRPNVLCHGLRMDRGRVAGLAVVKGKGIVMMPGPIQGAMNAFILLGLPMISRLSGGKVPETAVSAMLTRQWEARKKFPNFTKVVYLKVIRTGNETIAEPLAGETESMSLLTDSNAYAVIPEEVTSLEAGREIEARLLPGFSFAL